MIRVDGDLAKVIIPQIRKKGFKSLEQYVELLLRVARLRGIEFYYLPNIKDLEHIYKTLDIIIKNLKTSLEDEDIEYTRGAVNTEINRLERLKAYILEVIGRME